MIKPTRTPAQIKQDIADLDFQIDDYKHGEPQAWKLDFSVTEAERNLEKLKRELEVAREKEPFMQDVEKEISCE